jgi:hypothetical protein
MSKRHQDTGPRQLIGNSVLTLSVWIGLLCLVPSLAGAGVPILGPGASAPAPEVRMLERTSHGLTLEFELKALVVEDLNVAGVSYQMVSIPQGGESGTIGAPLIPVFNRLLCAPENATIRVTTQADDEEELSGYRLVPVQDEAAEGFAIDESAYARDDFGTDPAASVGSMGRLRDLTVCPIFFAPLRYNPARGTVRVAHRLRVQVEFSGAGQTSPLANPARPLTPSFNRLYRQLVVNYEEPPATVSVSNGTWLCICPNDAGVVARLQPLADWHKRQGYPARIVTTAETGTTNTQIKSYIQTAYNTWEDPPEYVVLAGDGSGTYTIPVWYVGGGEGDHPYTQLTGSDLWPDVNIGRLSFSSLTELEVIVAKSIGYASAPAVSDPAWFTRATVVGDPSHSGYSTVQVMQWLKTRLRQIGYAPIDTIFAAPYVSQMSASLNQGETVFCYRGYVGMSNWSNSNTSSLTNYWKLPFGVMSTCGTGDFDGSTSISEGFLRAGTTTNPRGAIGAIGTSTLSTHTRYNNCFTMGVWQGVVYEDIWEMGAAHSRGKVELILNYGAADAGAAANFCTWNNLMGDPACQVWTAFPAPLTVSHADVLPLGATSYSVTVTDTEGQAVPGVQVCLYKGTEIYQVGLTDAGGNCELAAHPATAGTAQLTLTKHNCQPVLIDVPVAALDTYVGFTASNLDDDENGQSVGNGDGSAEPGETIELGVQLQNFGIATASSVAAQLSIDDPYVTVTNGAGNFGSIEPGARAWSQTPFVFHIAQSCPHNHLARFALGITSGSEQWHALVEVRLVSADLVASPVTVYDPPGNRLDPGESLEISVGLTNRGGISAQGTGATLSSYSPWVSVEDPIAAYGTIPVGQKIENTVDRFRVRAASATPQGHLAMLKVVTTFNNGTTDTSWTSVTVGQATSDDPVGPDAYGYYAFDNTDIGYSQVPTYNWIEIDPAYGGTGTQVPLGDYTSYGDKSTTVDLPFTFKFYGRSFTRATICSNGWIAMGETYLTDYRNWTIPGAGSPQNLIAVFWDDLKETTGGGHVYQRYDAFNHRWIVAWSHMINDVSSAPETFEAIFYDPAYYPTDSGDGIILFQYSVVNNPDSIDGYATVGIQNWDHTVGLLYTYYGLYPSAAVQLATGRAIRFVPIVTNITGVQGEQSPSPSLSFSPARPNPFAGEASLAFSLAKPGAVRIAIYDPQGRRVRTLVAGTLSAGPHQIRWDGRDDQGHSVPQGIYFSRMEADGQALTRKVMRLE